MIVDNFVCAVSLVESVHSEKNTIRFKDYKVEIHFSVCI